jgi:hypothetical protein
VRLWDLPEPPFSTLLLVEDGVALCDRERAGVLVDEHGERHDVRRRQAAPVDNLADEVPGEHREAFVEAASVLFRSGNVPHQVATRWRSLVAEAGWCDPAEGDHLARHGLALAAAFDALDLRDASRERCGKLTFEQAMRVEQNIVRRWWRATCRSHRCPGCAKLLGLAEAQRLVAQLQRDEAAGRPPCVFFTVSVDRSRYETAVEAMKDLVNRLRAYDHSLRRRYGKDLAYWRTVESHAEGWPHVHLLVRSARLNHALVADAAVTGWPALVEACAAARDVPKGRRRRCPFPRERRWLNDAAVEAGLGFAGFYVEPVRDPEDAGLYLTKEQTRPSRSTIAGEMTKGRQVPVVLPRHFRRFRASGKAGDGKPSSFYLDEPKAEKAEVETLNLAIVKAKAEEVRDQYRAADVQIRGEVFSADMTGERDADGRWPRVLAGFAERTHLAATGATMDPGGVGGFVRR